MCVRALAHMHVLGSMERRRGLDEHDMTNFPIIHSSLFFFTAMLPGPAIPILSQVTVFCRWLPDNCGIAFCFYFVQCYIVLLDLAVVDVIASFLCLFIGLFRAFVEYPCSRNPWCLNELRLLHDPSRFADVSGVAAASFYYCSGCTLFIQANCRLLTGSYWCGCCSL